jgi:hypothetical protein
MWQARSPKGGEAKERHLRFIELTYDGRGWGGRGVGWHRRRLHELRGRDNVGGGGVGEIGLEDYRRFHQHGSSISVINVD